MLANLGAGGGPGLLTLGGRKAPHTAGPIGEPWEPTAWAAGSWVAGAWGIRTAGGFLIGELRAGPLLAGVLTAVPGERGSDGFELSGTLVAAAGVSGELSFLQTVQP